MPVLALTIGACAAVQYRDSRLVIGQQQLNAFQLCLAISFGGGFVLFCLIGVRLLLPLALFVLATALHASCRIPSMRAKATNFFDRIRGRAGAAAGMDAHRDAPEDADEHRLSRELAEKRAHYRATHNALRSKYVGKAPEASG